MNMVCWKRNYCVTARRIDPLGLLPQMFYDLVPPWAIDCVKMRRAWLLLLLGWLKIACEYFNVVKDKYCFLRIKLKFKDKDHPYI